MFSDNLVGRTSPCLNVIRTQNLKKEKRYFISKSNEEASILHPQILRAIIAVKDLTLMLQCEAESEQSMSKLQGRTCLALPYISFWRFEYLGT